MPSSLARPSSPLSYQPLEETFKSEPISHYDRNVRELQQLFGSDVLNMENRDQINLASEAQSNAPNNLMHQAQHVMEEPMEEEGDDSGDDCILLEDTDFPQAFPLPLSSDSDALTKREDDTISGNKPFNVTVIQPSSQ